MNYVLMYGNHIITYKDFLPDKNIMLLFILKINKNYK